MATPKSGISSIGDIAWGSHFCQFYRTQSDLTETLVPYFEAGLKDNESCLWVTAEPLEADYAEALMVDAMPDFKKRISSGQMQIISMKDWYTPGNKFDSDTVLQGWVDKEAESRSQGFSGLRLTGNTSWLDRSGWHDFREYEKKVNHTFGKYKIVALCTYCLDMCSADDVIDVCSHHEFALARREGMWEMLESSSLRIAKNELKRINSELESRVEERTALLNTAIRGRDEFLAMLGHELRNPLAPISAAANLLSLPGLTETKVRQTSQIISRQVKHMTSMVDDILDVSRVTSGLVTLDNAVLDVKQIISAAVEQVRPLIESHHHHLALHVPQGPATIRGDEKRLVQVLTNLLNNAAKYTPDGGRIDLKMEIEDEHVSLAVEDNGIGMASELSERAFELFAQGERSLDRAQGGLGLGLALVRSLVELHGGYVTSHSDGVGSGSEFRVYLPRLVNDDALSKQSDFTSALPTFANRLRLMIVDDNADAATMLTMYLEAIGHEVVVEHDAYRALERARVERPMVCLLDIGLPGMDGNELARRLRKQPETAKSVLIAITGYGRETTEKSSIAAGFDYHFVKPVDMAGLIAVLAKIGDAEQ